MDKRLNMWGRMTSINVQKVGWVMSEIRLECPRIDVGGMYGGLNDAEYIALNPNQRIPTLQDGDMVLWESNVICRYLVDAHDTESVLKGATSQERAQADMWMEWFQNNVYANFISLFHQLVRLPAVQRDPEVRARSLNALCNSLQLFDEALGQKDFILGDALSLGDIPTGACLYRYYTLDIERPQLNNLERYYERLTQRPSFREAVMIDYSSLRAPD